MFVGKLRLMASETVEEPYRSFQSVTGFFGEKPICPVCESTGSLLVEEFVIGQDQKILCVYCGAFITPSQYYKKLQGRRREKFK